MNANRAFGAAQYRVLAMAGQLERWSGWLLAVLVLAFATTAMAAATRTSLTWDEPIYMAGGARGWETGKWDIIPETAPLMLYLYGLPVHLLGVNHPQFEEAPDLQHLGMTPQTRDFSFRYGHARRFFFTVGNNPVTTAFTGRILATLFAVTMIVLVFGYVRESYGAGVALAAAALTAFMPDVLAHAGVAYNDIPFAAMLVAALWMADRTARTPSAMRGAASGVVLGIALLMKHSGPTVFAAAGLIALAEFVARSDKVSWLRRAGVAAVVALVVVYLVLVAGYQGDFALSEYRWALGYTLDFLRVGHGYPTYFMGEMRESAPWWAYAALFLFKTPAALHVLLAAAVVGLIRGSRNGGFRSAMQSPLRMPVAGILVLGASVLSSKLLLAFRYALPILPLMAIVVAVGVARLWRRSRWLPRATIAGVFGWFVASTLSVYPHFLAYSSEWGPGRDRAYTLFVGPSLDWGQGLLDLRQWMDRRGIDRVYLSYYGSALPDGYGIHYITLPSFGELPDVSEPGAPPPEYTVISVSNLVPVFLRDDPFARFRTIQPDTVIAHTLLVYRTGGEHPLARRPGS